MHEDCRAADRARSISDLTPLQFDHVERRCNEGIFDLNTHTHLYETDLDPSGWVRIKSGDDFTFIVPRKTAEASGMLINMLDPNV